MLALLGLLLLGFAISMLANPERFSNGIISFSHWRYFHVFEVLSRLLVGALLLLFASTATYPMVFTVIGGVFVLIGAGLALTPLAKHRQFAEWSAHHFKNKFRLIGIATVPLATFLMYAGW